jgi:hypothetical protein
MNIQAAIYSWLSDQSGITDIISTRIYPLFLPQDAAYPAIRYEMESADREQSYDGQGNFVGASFQIDSMATTHTSALALADAVKAALLNYSGFMGTISVNQAFLVAEGDFYEEQLKVFRCSQSWLIWHYED